MAMTVAKIGVRQGVVSVTISARTSMMSFSAAFLRAHNITPENTTLVRLGYDPEIRCIGLDFPKKDQGRNECYKLNWTAKRSNASCPVRALLPHSGLTLKEIAAVYKDKRLQGPLEIPGFSSKGFLLGPIAGTSKKNSGQ